MKVDSFQERIFRAVAMIPKGRVGTYAQVAELAGYAGAARAAGNALHLNTGPAKIPCRLEQKTGQSDCIRKDKGKILIDGVLPLSYKHYQQRRISKKESLCCTPHSSGHHSHAPGE